MSQPSATPGFGALSRNDQLFLGGTLLAFICTFLPYDGISEGGFSASENAWHGIGVLACILVLLALVAAIAAAFAPTSVPELPVSMTVLTLGLMVLAFIFFIIRWLTLPSYSGFGIHIGLSLHWGGYVTLIVTALTAAVGFLRFRDSGEAAPWQQRAGGSTPPPV